MGWTLQQTLVPTKRAFNNENISSGNTSHGSETECEDEGMRAQFNKRSRDTSPQRRPLVSVDMLAEIQHAARKAELANSDEYTKETPINFDSFSEVVDSVYSATSASISLEAGKEILNSTSQLSHHYKAIREDGCSLPQIEPQISRSRSSRSLSKGPTLKITARRGLTGKYRAPKSKFNNRIRNNGSGDACDPGEEDAGNSAGEDEESDEISTTTSDGDEKEAESSGTTDDNSESLVAKAQSVPVKIIPGIRPSQFPYVPPFINFCQHNEKCECLPAEIKKLMKWRLSTITPTVVRTTVTSSGFRPLKKTVEWTGQWGKHLKAAMFRAALKDYQKLNHLPATFQVGRKDKLWRNYQRYNRNFGNENFGFLPKSYILPQEMKSFKLAWDSSGKGRPWIIKPPAGARGDGIRVINKWGQVPKKRPTIVQKYIVKPLLINSRKFDIRLYVLVTSFHPFKIYIYRDGLVRFAPVKYSQDSKRVSDRFMHLTNYSINKHCDLYSKNENPDSMEGHKWTLQSLWRYLKKEGHDVDELWNSIEDIAIKTLVCAEEPITAASFNLPTRYNGYELFGLDVILDEKMKPWLLEVNISPSLHSNSPLDLAVKGPLIREVFNIVGYHFPDLMSSALKKKFAASMNRDMKLETPVFDRRLYSSVLSPEEKMKQHLIKKNFQHREKYLSAVLENLSGDDLRHLIQSEDELSQCDRFKRIFPTTNTYEYFQFLEFPRYYNQLLDAWEHKYAGCRQTGISRLQQLCNSKIHLNVTQNGTEKNTILGDADADGSLNNPVETNGVLTHRHLVLEVV